MLYICDSKEDIIHSFNIVGGKKKAERKGQDLRRLLPDTTNVDVWEHQQGGLP